MSEAAKRIRERVVEGAVGGPGFSASGARRAAFDNHGVDERARRLIDKVAREAWKITNEDVAEAKAAGVSENEIFELVVCAALGQSTRQLSAALTALDTVTGTPSTRAPGQDVRGTR